MNKAQKAIVIGGSFAGLWTARVLADHFEHVEVLERDQMPTTAESRAGVPQDKHIHVLLKRGADIMVELFPGIWEELVDEGAIEVDLINDVRFNIRGTWMPRFESELASLGISRIKLESIIRKRVFALPNVSLRDGAQVKQICHEHGKITGVQVLWKAHGQTIEEMADFVVDASGRGSKAPQWLESIGYGTVEETVIDAKLGYAGRRFKTPAGMDREWSMMGVGQEYPDNTRSGLISREENGVWMVMLAGIMGDYPPTDEAGFMAFAETLGPEFYSAIRDAEPVSSIIGYRRTENRLRHYEKLKRWPDRFVIVGDATCGFNPVYGQGMSVSAIAAVELGRALAGSNRLDGVAARFQKRYPKIIEAPWLLATSSDLEWVGNKEATTLAERIAGWYMPKLIELIPTDPAVRTAFTQVQNLLAPPTALFRPDLAWKVFRAALA